MIILDTNVLSALMRDVPDEVVVSWLDRQPATSIWTTSITVFEIVAGLERMPVGRRRTALSGAFENLLEELGQRVAVFDDQAARAAGNLTAVRQTKGRAGELRDTMIAGIVLAHHASLATCNVSHFADIGTTVIDPWAA